MRSFDEIKARSIVAEHQMNNFETLNLINNVTMNWFQFPL